MRLPLRPQMLAVPTFALVWLAAVVPSAEASFPGRNGLIAFAGEGPPFNTKRVPEGAWTIRVVNPRSGRARQLTHVPRRCGRRGWTWGDGEVSYSASGRLLAYSHVDSCDPRTADGLYIMRADGSGRRLIRRMTLDEDDLPEYPAILRRESCWPSVNTWGAHTPRAPRGLMASGISVSPVGNTGSGARSGAIRKYSSQHGVPTDGDSHSHSAALTVKANWASATSAPSTLVGWVSGSSPIAGTTQCRTGRRPVTASSLSARGSGRGSKETSLSQRHTRGVLAVRDV